MALVDIWNFVVVLANEQHDELLLLKRHSLGVDCGPMIDDVAVNDVAVVVAVVADVDGVVGVVVVVVDVVCDADDDEDIDYDFAYDFVDVKL